MSNNIYDILKKIESLEAPKKTLTESKSMNTVKELHNESKKEKQTHKGTIAEAVAQVEQQLNEKYMGFKKKMSEAAYTNPGLEALAAKKRAEKKSMSQDEKDKVVGAVQTAMRQSRANVMQGRNERAAARMNAKIKHGMKEDIDYDINEGSYNEEMLSPKQKSFAALAEPKDKITYADKIAGAKKGKKDESNKYIGNLMKARADGKDEADLDGDGDMEKVSKGVSTMREGWEEMQKYLDKKRGPESKGGAGKKAGTRYGGSAQKDDDEETDGEGKPKEKKKGRPKGTGGGAKFSFKKPKD